MPKCDAAVAAAHAAAFAATANRAAMIIAAVRITPKTFLAVEPSAARAAMGR